LIARQGALNGELFVLHDVRRIGHGRLRNGCRDNGGGERGGVRAAGPWRLSLYAGCAAVASGELSYWSRGCAGAAAAGLPPSRVLRRPVQTKGRKGRVAGTSYPVTLQPLARRKHKCHTGADASDCGTVRQVTEYERQPGSVFPANARHRVSMVEHANCLFGQRWRRLTQRFQGTHCVVQSAVRRRDSSSSAAASDPFAYR
jgi:hypothetical protein